MTPAVPQTATAEPIVSGSAVLSPLQELEVLLLTSHDTRIFDELQEFAKRHKKSQQAIFATPGVLFSPPVYCDKARADGVWSEEDEFIVLQGDIIFTDAAYLLGQRLEAGYFAVANATCDLMPGRRENAFLFRVPAIYAPTTPEETHTVKSRLGALLAFKSSQSMYLPPLPEDDPNIIARFVDFNTLAQARAVAVGNATRFASLGQIGWRIFGVHLHRLIAREGNGEADLREAIFQATNTP